MRHCVAVLFLVHLRQAELQPVVLLAGVLSMWLWSHKLILWLKQLEIFKLQW